MTNTMNPRLIVIVAMGLAASAITQMSQLARSKFAVASIKPNKTNCCVSGGVGNGGSSNRDVTLKILIATAYRVQEFQISGGPAWIGSDRFDVDANSPCLNPDFRRSANIVDRRAQQARYNALQEGD